MHFTMVMKVIMMMSYNENNKQQQLLEDFVNSCNKMFHQFFYKKLINNFVVCKHQKHFSGTLVLVEDVKNHTF